MKKMSDDGTMTSCEKFTAYRYRTPNAWELGVDRPEKPGMKTETILGMALRLVNR